MVIKEYPEFLEKVEVMAGPVHQDLLDHRVHPVHLGRQAL